MFTVENSSIPSKGLRPLLLQQIESAHSAISRFTLMHSNAHIKTCVIASKTTSNMPVTESSLVSLFVTEKEHYSESPVLG